MRGCATPTPPAAASEPCTSEADTDAELEAEHAKQAVTVWERLPRPIASADTDYSCDDHKTNASDISAHKLLKEMKSAQEAMKKEKEFSTAVEEEILKIEAEKENLEIESTKIADEKETLQRSIQEAALRERELKDNFEKEFMRKLLVPKEQEIERLQAQVKDLTTLAYNNKQQFIEYERRMKELASSLETPNAQGGIATLREIVSDLQKHVETMRQSLQETRVRNEGLQRALANKGAEAQAQAQLAFRHAQALQARDAHLHSLAAALRMRERHSCKIEREVRRQTEQMAELRRLLQMRDAQLCHLSQMVDALNRARPQGIQLQVQPPPEPQQLLPPQMNTVPMPQMEPQMQMQIHQQQPVQQLVHAQMNPPIQTEFQTELHQQSQIHMQPQMQQQKLHQPQHHFLQELPTQQAQQQPQSPNLNSQQQLLLMQHGQSSQPHNNQLEQLSQHNFHQKQLLLLQQQLQSQNQTHQQPQLQNKIHLQQQQLQPQNQPHLQHLREEQHIQKQIQSQIQPHLQQELQPQNQHHPQQKLQPENQSNVQYLREKPHQQKQIQSQNQLHLQQELQPQNQPHLQQKLQPQNQPHVHHLHEELHIKKQIQSEDKPPHLQQELQSHKNIHLQQQDQPHLQQRREEPHLQKQIKSQPQIQQENQPQSKLHLQKQLQPQNQPNLHQQRDEPHIQKQIQSQNQPRPQQEMQPQKNIHLHQQREEPEKQIQSQNQPHLQQETQPQNKLHLQQQNQPHLQQQLQPHQLHIHQQRDEPHVQKKIQSQNQPRPQLDLQPQKKLHLQQREEPYLQKQIQSQNQPHLLQEMQSKNKQHLQQQLQRQNEPKLHQQRDEPHIQKQMQSQNQPHLQQLREEPHLQKLIQSQNQPHLQQEMQPQNKLYPQQQLQRQKQPHSQQQIQLQDQLSAQQKLQSQSPPHLQQLLKPYYLPHLQQQEQFEQKKKSQLISKERLQPQLNLTRKPQNFSGVGDTDNCYSKPTPPLGTDGVDDDGGERQDGGGESAPDGANSTCASAAHQLQHAMQLAPEIARLISKAAAMAEVLSPHRWGISDGFAKAAASRTSLPPSAQPSEQAIRIHRKRTASVAAMPPRDAASDWVAAPPSAAVVSRAAETALQTLRAALSSKFPPKPNNAAAPPNTSIEPVLSDKHPCSSRGVAAPDAAEGLRNIHSREQHPQDDTAGAVEPTAEGSGTFVLEDSEVRQLEKDLNSSDSHRPESDRRAEQRDDPFERSNRRDRSISPPRRPGSSPGALRSTSPLRRRQGERQEVAGSWEVGGAATAEEVTARRPSPSAWRPSFVPAPKKKLPSPQPLPDSRRSRSLESRSPPECEWPAAGEPARHKGTSAVDSAAGTSRPCTTPTPRRQSLFFWDIVPRRDEPVHPENTGHPSSRSDDETGSLESPTDSVIRELFIDPKEDQQNSKNAKRNIGEKAAGGNTSFQVYHATAHTNTRARLPVSPGGFVWEDGDDVKESTWGSANQHFDKGKTPRSLSPLAVPSGDTGLQVPTRDASPPPPKVQLGSRGSPAKDGTCGAGSISTTRSRCLNPDKRHRLSPLRRIRELPKIVEFSEESNTDSASDDSTAAVKDSEKREEGKDIVFEYKDEDPKSRQTRVSVFSVSSKNSDTQTHEENESSADTLSPTTWYSQIAKNRKSEDESAFIQSQKQTDPHKQKARSIVVNLESILETQLNTDQRSMASKCNSSQIEIENAHDESIDQNKRRRNKFHHRDEADSREALNNSDTFVYDKEEYFENDDAYSVTKESVLNKLSSGSLSSKRRSNPRHSSSRCAMEEEFIIPFVPYDCNKRHTRSGSDIFEEIWSCESMLIPEFHIVHADCVCQSKRGNFQ